MENRAFSWLGGPIQLQHPLTRAVTDPVWGHIALSVLDEHFAAKWAALGPDWTRIKRRRAGHPVMKLVRYADDFVVMVGGTRADADALWDEVGAVLAPMGLRLCPWPCESPR